MQDNNEHFPSAEDVIFLLLGLLIIAAIAVIIFQGMKEVEGREIYEIIKDWQTLIGAGLALIAAIWTIKKIEKQIVQKEQEIQEEKEREAERAAQKSLGVRSFLPDALASLSRYAKQCLRYYYTRDQNDFPNPPTEDIATIKNNIEHMPINRGDEALDLVVWYQIVNSRLEKGFDGDLEAYVLGLDIIKLHFLVFRLFSYARLSGVEEIEIERAEERNALNLLLCNSLKNCTPAEMRGTHRQAYEELAEKKPERISQDNVFQKIMNG